MYACTPVYGVNLAIIQPIYVCSNVPLLPIISEILKTDAVYYSAAKAHTLKLVIGYVCKIVQDPNMPIISREGVSQAALQLKQHMQIQQQTDVFVYVHKIGGLITQLKLVCKDALM